MSKKWERRGEARAPGPEYGARGLQFFVRNRGIHGSVIGRQWNRKVCVRLAVKLSFLMPPNWIGGP